ncbi:hypothetical protein SEA_GUDMIT_59 [Gordonia phage Gudmit]|nr:hypothetical protein SEA_GUDMIT_59 [Gordonia phage Gudmit]
MTWFKVDDGFWSHPKVMMLSPEATSLWVRAGSYACQHLTDGAIPSAVLPILGSPDAAQELVESGLWKAHRQGFRFHDWADFQETSDEVKKRREQARERQRRARASREKKRNESQGESRVTSHVTNGVTSQEVSTPDPTRPDPTRPTPNGVCVPLPDEPPIDDYVPSEIETSARPSTPKASSVELAFIRQQVGRDLPTKVEQSLVVEVRKLRRQYDRGVIEQALGKWSARDGAPGLLPYLVADIVKAGNRPAEASKADIWDASVIAPAQAAASAQRRLS